MINPDDFKVSSEPGSVLKGTRIRVGLRLTGEVICRETELEERETQRLKVQAWDAVYGEVERKLNEMRRNILMGASIQPYAYEQVNAAINEVAALVRNPFA